MAQRRATTPSIYHSLLPTGTPPLLPIPLHAPSTSCRADIPEADTPPRKRLLLIAPMLRVEIGEDLLLLDSQDLLWPTSVTVSDDQYAVFNGTKYAVLIFLNEYVVLDRKLDMSYLMEVDTPSGAQGCKAWRPSSIAWSGGQGWWSGGQDVGVVPKGVASGKREIMGRVHGCFWTANIGLAVMSSDSAVTYTSVHSEAPSWSIPSENPYEEAAQKLLEQAPHPSKYVPDPMELEDHVPVYILEPEQPMDLVPAEDEAPIEPYITEVASTPTPPLPPPSLLPILIRPPHTRAAMAQRRAIAPSIYHSLLLVGTPPLLPIPLPAPSTSRRADIPDADTPPQNRLLLTAPTPRVKVGESSAAAAR
ncbi:hypothetical protein Tco_1457504 [Tanacetum coccineum]